MNTNDTLETANNYPDNSEPSASVDDFIRELEHLEQDLHITSELEIEVSESEIDDSNLPDFIVQDLKIPGEKSKEAHRPQLSTESQGVLKSEIVKLEDTITKFKAERLDAREPARRRRQDF